MIYVLKSAAMVGDSDDPFTSFIKIGYTVDWSKRYQTYLNHNPTITLLYLIEGGAPEDEFNVLNYFRGYGLRQYGNEWFLYMDQIIDFFEKHKTIEEIRSAIPIARRVGVSVKSSILEGVVGIIEDVVENLDYQKLLDDFEKQRFIIMSQVLAYIRDIFPDKADIIIDRVIEWYTIRSKIKRGDYTTYFSVEEKQVLEFLQGYFSAGGNNAKVKYFFNKPIPNNILFTVLNQVSDSLKKAYLVLGPEECKKYDSYTKIKCAYVDHLTLEALGGKRILAEKIYSKFEIGKIYPAFDFIYEFREVFRGLGLKRSFMDEEVYEWFDARKIRYIREDGKERSGYELLARKQ